MLIIIIIIFLLSRQQNAGNRTTLHQYLITLHQPLCHSPQQ